MPIVQKIAPCLWFDFNGEEAVTFYTSVFKNSRILRTAHYLKDGHAPEGTVMVIEFELEGVKLVALNGGPHFKFTEAISLMIECKDQAEIDYYWNALLEGGGEPGPCGWLKDRFGLSWQIYWSPAIKMYTDPDQEKANGAFQALMKMGKIEIATLQNAFDGK
ncbi:MULTISPECIES: VOC family protein [Mesorhizobium]|uniref:VOC family protein n=1 Tax=Mesorhizobium denitrificans TaxID=2294114 RepID=A0A371XCT3_9HYPH|nr:MULTISPECIES: VOC family protein [Mesorhizobium]RFC67028.1 VOC family protein [Mesorhizobium denitrificans]